MKKIEIKKRYRLGKKDMQFVRKKIIDIYNPMNEPGETLEFASGGGYDFIIDRKNIVMIIKDNDYIITTRGAIFYRPEKKFVTVDMGAVKFVTNGADIMTPGIVNADSEIKKGDPTWIKDQEHNMPIASGITLLAGSELVESKTGKGIKSITHVGDPVWNIELS